MMESDTHTDTKKPLILHPGEGRQYSMGRMSACFKADCDETGYRMSASEWWLEPDTDGPPVHSHPEDHVYYLLEGQLRVFLHDRWHQVKKGACIYIPGGTEHSFENRSDVRAGFLSINTPGGFESEMPGIVQWFKENDNGTRRHDVQPDGQELLPATDR